MKRWTTAFLILSLIVNAGLVGVVAGDVLRPLRALATLGGHIPKEMRSALRERLVADRSELRDDLAAFTDARDRYFGLMRETPLDETAIEAAAAEVRARTSALQERIQDATIAVLRTMPEAERRAIETPKPLSVPFLNQNL